jgi:hypothetical protein
MSHVNVNLTYGQHADATRRVSGRGWAASTRALPALWAGCAADADLDATTVQTPVLSGRNAVVGMTIKGAFAGTGAWSPPS